MWEPTASVAARIISGLDSDCRTRRGCEASFMVAQGERLVELQHTGDADLGAALQDSAARPHRGWTGPELFEALKESMEFH